MGQFAGESIIQSLIGSKNPSVSFRARRLLGGEDPSSPAMAALRRRIRRGEAAVRLLAHRDPDGTIPTNPYKKWQGPHWTLYSLAQIDYPPGDRSLEGMRNQVYDWLLSRGHMEFPSTLVIPGQKNRVRRCASQEGNAVWYSILLGLVDRRTRVLVDRLIDLQWPDGGWNCDKRPEARCSSIIETLVPVRALIAFGRFFEYEPAVRCARRAIEFLLARRLLYRVSDGELIRPSWGGDITKIHYPIQFYDVLFALTVMCEAGVIADERCTPALRLLATKRRGDGGFPVEITNCTSSDSFVSRGSFADWGPHGVRASNPFVTIDALRVLGSAGVDPPSQSAPPGRTYSLDMGSGSRTMGGL